MWMWREKKQTGFDDHRTPGKGEALVCTPAAGGVGTGLQTNKTVKTDAGISRPGEIRRAFLFGANCCTTERWNF